MKLTCPNCGQRLEADDDFPIGQPVECPKCSKSFNVSKGNIVTEKAAQFGAGGEKRMTTCPDCGNPISKRARVCPHCGSACPRRSEDVAAMVITGVLVCGGVIAALCAASGLINATPLNVLQQIYYTLVSLTIMAGAVFLLLLALIVKR